MGEDEKRINSLEWENESLRWDYGSCRHNLRLYKIGFWFSVSINLVWIIAFLTFASRVWS